MGLFINVSDDTLEMIARHLSMEEKCRLLATGDCILTHRLKRRIYDHKLTLMDERLENWQHLRSLKLSFEHLVRNLMTSPNDAADNCRLNEHLIFNNLVTLQVHFIGVCWMQRLGGEKLARQFANLLVLKFFNLLQDKPYDRSYINFGFLQHFLTLKELIFDERCNLSADELWALPSSLEKLHIPMMTFASIRHEDRRLLFPSTCTLSDLFIKRLDLFGSLPSSLKRLQILHGDDYDFVSNPPPKGLTSLIIHDGLIKRTTLSSSHFPQSLNELSVPVVHDDIPPEFYKQQRDPRCHHHQVIRFTFKYSRSFLPRSMEEKTLIAPMIATLVMDCSSEQEFAFSCTVHLMVNLVKLIILRRSDVSAADLVSSRITRQSFSSFRDFHLPASLRHLTITIQRAHFAEIQYGDDMELSVTTIGTHFLHRSVGDRHCPLVRCTTLESLEILFAEPGLVETDTVTIREDVDMLEVVSENIPRGLKSLEMNYVGDENLFAGDSFSKLMAKIVGATKLSLRHISAHVSQVEWSSHLSLLPRSLKHLIIQLISDDDAYDVPVLPIEALPWRLKTIVYSAYVSGFRVSDLATKTLENILSYKKKTGKMPLPCLRTIGHSYIQHIPDDPDYDFLKTSRLEHHFKTHDLA